VGKEMRIGFFFGRPLRRPRRRWKYNIKTDIREIGWSDVDWIELARNQRGLL
jgi:hypothetical protein